MKPRISKLFERVKEIENAASEAAKNSNLAANDASGGLVASYSVAGDVEHARNSANLSMQKAEAIKRLSEEIQSDLETPIKETVEPACFISLVFEDGSSKEIYLVKNPVFIPGVNLISPESLMGQALVGKKKGDEFSYYSGTQTFRGEVEEIE